ncbi:DUF6247 family protein [Actinacidiphila glaucinigra]|uniref:Uncharacterized protein n=1 Tax=Actinacidiphila glaucinigra TaxID=235986 RepID=A0A239MR15_9ACTN|nr:DUF6247 family protein [Actinacidiphila glaucinigra]SNT44564.1 hypothetical protein SAMN05216252_12632 [Actinacidiphila glaucinigra]
MSTASEHPERRSVPQPSTTAEELRAALARIAPEAVPTFDAERAAAMAQARSEVSSAPVRRFLGQWALQVAIERHPEQAARLRHLEARAAVVEDPDEARTVAAEIGWILDKAATEAGLPRSDQS